MSTRRALKHPEPSMTLRRLEKHGGLDGWVQGNPPIPPNTRINPVMLDLRVAERAMCMTCGQEGLRYVPFHREEYVHGTCNYRAFTVCPNCGQADEF